MNTNNTMQEISNFCAVDCFVKSYIRDDNLTERQEEGLGIAISKWAEWDGLTIMRVFSAALEDANYHEEAGIVDQLIEERS